MRELMVKNNELFGEVRFAELNGKMYAVGSDVAKALGYAIPSKAINTHCKGVSKMEVPTNGGVQEMLIIPEGDIYRLITKSKLPQAEQFEQWVFDEVLPSIRKNGAYMTENTIEKVLTDPDFLIKLATQLKEEKQARIEAETKLIEQAPKVDKYDRFLDSDNCYTATSVSKITGLNSARALNKKLNELGIQFKQGKEWKPYASVNKEFYKLIPNEFGSTILKWTPKGLDFIIDLLEEN